jgi:hypothetical protein
LENLKGRNNSEDLDMMGNSIRMDLREMGWKVVDWLHVVQDRASRWLL